MLFVKPRVVSRELWDGPTTGVERAKEFFGADEVHDVTNFATVLSSLLPAAKDVYYHNVESGVDVESVLTNVSRVYSCRPIIESIRTTKTAVEQNLMRKSCQNSAEAFVEVMKQVRPGQNESFIEALMEFECRKRGSFRLAYPPVMASGKSNLILHYIANSAVLK